MTQVVFSLPLSLTCMAAVGAMGKYIAPRFPQEEHGICIQITQAQTLAQQSLCDFRQISAALVCSPVIVP